MSLSEYKIPSLKDKLAQIPKQVDEQVESNIEIEVGEVSEVKEIKKKRRLNK